MTVASPLGARRIGQIVADGSLREDQGRRMALGRREIMRLLGDELPPIRSTGARAILEQELRCVDDLVAMLDSDNRFARYGACYALTDSGYRSAKAVARLVERVETSDDLDLRLNALDALSGSDPETGLGPAAKGAIPALLRLAVKRFDIDPRRLLQRRLGFALFDTHGLVTLHGIEGIDDAILIPAIRELLTVDDGRSRSLVSRIYPSLNDGQRRQLWRDIHRATRDMSPSGIMFADGVRLNGLKLMLANNVEEGVQMTIDYMSESRWGQGRRHREVLPILAGYGPAAKKALPALLKMKEAWSASKKTPERDMAKLDSAIEAIRTGKAKDLKSIRAYLEPARE
jgi:hypothetical protein